MENYPGNSDSKGEEGVDRLVYIRHPTKCGVKSADGRADPGSEEDNRRHGEQRYQHAPLRRDGAREQILESGFAHILSGLLRQPTPAV